MPEFKCRSCNFPIEFEFDMQDISNPDERAKYIPVVDDDIICDCGIIYTASELTARAEKYLKETDEQVAVDRYREERGYNV